MTALIVALCLGAPPALAEEVPANALGWLHLPRISESLAVAKASPLGPLAGQVLGPAEKLAGHPKAVLLATAHGRRPEQVYGLVTLDAGAASAAVAELWRRMLAAHGFAPPAGDAAKGVELLRRGDERVALTRDAQRVRLVYEPDRVAKKDTGDRLADDERFAALHAAHPDAHLLARIDVRKLYGVLARGPDAAPLAATIDRLGLLGLEEVVADVTWPEPKRLETSVTIELPGRRSGFVAALGEPRPPLAEAPLPKGVLSIVRLSVEPAELFYAAAKLVNYHRPLVYGLFATQLRALEDQARVMLDEDVLGKASQTWTVYRLLVEDRPRSVLVAGIADGKDGRALLEVVIAAMPGLSPRTRVERSKHHGAEVITLGGRRTVAVAIVGHSLILGRSASAVAEVLRRRKEIEPGSGSGAAVLISAIIDGAAEGGFAAGAGLLGGLDRDQQRDLAGRLGKSRLTLREGDKAFVLQLSTGLRSPARRR